MKKVYVICNSIKQFLRLKKEVDDMGLDVRLHHVTSTFMIRGLPDGFRVVKMEECYRSVPGQDVEEYEFILHNSKAKVFLEKEFKGIKDSDL